MSKKKNFHQLIENSNQEEKASAWQRIQEQSCVPVETVSFPTPKKRKIVTWKKALVSGLVSVVVLGTGAFFGVKYLSQDDAPSIRYCENGTYTMQDVSLTLKDRVQKENKKVLFLDWYDVTDFYVDQAYVLNANGEEIGYYEEIVDVTTGSMITINAVDKNYELQSLGIYTQGTEIVYINSVEITWRKSNKCNYATFTYGDYDYYISLESPMEEDSILDIVEEMLLCV